MDIKVALEEKVQGAGLKRSLKDCLEETTEHMFFDPMLFFLYAYIDPFQTAGQLEHTGSKSKDVWM